MSQNFQIIYEHNGNVPSIQYFDTVGWATSALKPLAMAVKVSGNSAAQTTMSV